MNSQLTTTNFKQLVSGRAEILDKYIMMPLSLVNG